MKKNNLSQPLNILCLLALTLSLIIALTEFFFDNKNDELPADVAAIVNEEHIKIVDYMTAVAMINEDKRSELNKEDYQLVIDRLIEEEILFQYGLTNGIIYQSDISKKIIDNMLANVFSSITSTQKSEKEVYDFYLKQIKNNAQFAKAMKNQSFSDIQLELTAAIMALEKNSAIRSYVKILQNKASINFNPKHPISASVIKLREEI